MTFPTLRAVTVHSDSLEIARQDTVVERERDIVDRQAVVVAGRVCIDRRFMDFGPNISVECTVLQKSGFTMSPLSDEQEAM